MSSENAWGGFCAAVALFFKDLVIKLDGVEFIGINLLTHSATVGMGFFLAGMMSRFLSKSGNALAVEYAIEFVYFYNNQY
ncbi:unnamed protein product [Meloidogyne enterolobii]|uniref:Uncharacterized protein n=1 Tax=Meloidogyne enterolobii TaxID=390850 RepID=A0ACB1AP25_MELEN